MGITAWHEPLLCLPKSFLDFSQVATFNFVVVLLAFLFVDIFDTLGTLIGVSSKANMLDDEGRLPRIKGALMADAVAPLQALSSASPPPRPMSKVQQVSRRVDAPVSLR